MTWHQVSLKQICEVDWGNTKLTKSSYVAGGEFLAVSAAGADGLIDHYEHEANVPVLSAIGAQCGRMFYPGARFTAIKNTITLTPKDNMADGKFLYYLFTSVELPQRGAGQPFISKGDIESFKVFIPESLEEQRKIVGKLDSAFAKIDLLEGNLALSDEKANQLLQSLLSVEFTFSGDSGQPTSPLVNQGLVMSFTSKPLGELCTLTMGRTPPRGNSRYWDSSRKTKNIWISIADMTKSLDDTLIDSKEYLSDEGSNSFPKVKMGTLLLSFKLSIGKLAIAGADLQTNEAIMAMNELNEDLILRDYLYYFLRGFDWSEALEGRFKVKGNTLNKKILEELPIKFPSIEKQREIVVKLDIASAEIESLKAQIKVKKDSAAALRQSLLNSAFAQQESVA
jgi:restriction endonuclease S subunit